MEPDRVELTVSLDRCWGVVAKDGRGPSLLHSMLDAESRYEQGGLSLGFERGLAMAEKVKYAAGVDVGSRSVKVALGASGPEGFRILALAVEEFEGGRGGRELSVEEVSRTVASAVQKVGASLADAFVATGLAGRNVVIRFIELPRMSREDAAGAISYEAEQFLPFDTSECVMDYEVLDPEGKSRRMQVVIVAAKRDYVEERVQALTQAGLAPHVVDVEAFAVLNAFLRNKRWKDGETVGVVNVGAQITSVGILRDGVPAFGREVNLAGDHLTEAIAKGARLSLEEAEALKRAEADAANLQGPMTYLGQMLEELASELRMSFDYFENQSGGSSVSKVYLCGGTGKLRNMDRYLSEVLHQPVELWNPLQGLVPEEELSSPELAGAAPLAAVAVGLALRGETHD